MKRRSALWWAGAAAVVAIVVASIVVRTIGPADPAADIGEQREAVTAFHDLFVDGRWNDVYRSMTEPPTDDVASFTELMADEVDERGKVVGIEIDDIQLLRSRAVPMLEVRERVVIETSDGTRDELTTVSFFARQGEVWLFAFSAPAA